MMMKKTRYILLVLCLIAGLNAYSQVVDFYSSVNYGISLPMGDTKNFIKNSSFRGFSFEFGRFITDEISLGFMGAWYVFYENFPKDTYEFDNLTVTGKKYHYINAFPLMLAGRYHFRFGSQLRPYAGAGTGTYIINKTTDMGLYNDQNKNWHFGIYPEAGILFELGTEMYFNLGARYNYAFKAGGDQHSWLSFQAGITFIY